MLVLVTGSVLERTAGNADKLGHWAWKAAQEKECSYKLWLEDRAGELLQRE
jgi:hypothetical protein